MAFGKSDGLKAVPGKQPTVQPERDVTTEQAGPGPPCRRMWQEQDEEFPQEHC